jgi:hypothetical protein
MESRKIEWLNHSIAFASSVVGIFIAFQLDDWQERRSKQEEVALTLKAIRAEIEGNLAVYRMNDSTLGAFIEFVDFHNANTHDGGLLLSRKELTDAMIRFPGRLDDARVIRKLNDTLAVYRVQVNINVAPTSGISTGNWEAAAASGILAHLDHDRTVLLTQVYEWTTKDLGYSDDELYGSLISFKDFDNTDQILEHYRMIVKVSRMKYTQMRSYYDRIEW